MSWLLSLLGDTKLSWIQNLEAALPSHSEPTTRHIWFQNARADPMESGWRILCSGLARVHEIVKITLCVSHSNVIYSMLLSRIAQLNSEEVTWKGKLGPSSHRVDRGVDEVKCRTIATTPTFIASAAKKHDSLHITHNDCCSSEECETIKSAWAG